MGPSNLTEPPLNVENPQFDLPNHSNERNIKNWKIDFSTWPTVHGTCSKLSFYSKFCGIPFLSSARKTISNGPTVHKTTKLHEKANKINLPQKLTKHWIST